jgi:hypothetical protein
MLPGITKIIIEADINSIRFEHFVQNCVLSFSEFHWYKHLGTMTWE